MATAIGVFMHQQHEETGGEYQHLNIHDNSFPFTCESGLRSGPIPNAIGIQENQCSPPW